MEDAQILAETADKYSKYLHVQSNNMMKEKKSDIEANFEAVLTRLDEFYGMLDMIRNDTTTVSEETLPTFKAETNKMQLVFQQIDDLERFVDVIKRDYQTMEKCVKDAESEYGSVNSIKKALSSFRFSNLWNKPEQPQTVSHRQEFQPPTVYRTSEYILPKVKETDHVS